jgi:thiosulfate/3-mercaptopyruvate sulfurtransferase
VVIDRVRHDPVSPLVPSAGLLTAPVTGALPLIVDPGWLVDQRADPVSPPLIVDLSSRTQYETEHIPGAIHAWWQDGMDLHAPAYGQLLSDRTGPSARQRWLQSLGITRGTTVVAYDDSGGRDAARLAWMLRYMNNDGAAVLNGGLAAWKSFGLPVTSAPTQPPDVELIDADRDLSWLIATDELERRLGDPSLTIVDIRSDEEAASDLNGTIRSGRIPRSVPLPWTSLMEADGARIKPPEQLAASFRAAGLAPEDEIALYGLFGMDTGRVWTALAAAGFPNARVYDGGWAYWASVPELPIEPLPDDTVIYARRAIP